MSTLKDQLFDEILQARQRVYAVGAPTPMQEICLPEVGATVFAKREDLGPIKAYKWRGAYNCMAKLSPEQRANGRLPACRPLLLPQQQFALTLDKNLETEFLLLPATHHLYPPDNG